MAQMETGPFVVGERALVPFTDKNYEAKVLKAEFREDGMWYYFVHYNGWNKKYDTWVEDVGLIKMPAGSELGPSVPGGAIGGVAGVVSGAPTSGVHPKIKRITMKDKFLKSTAGISNAAEGAVVLLDLDMPGVLKRALLDDYDAVVEEGRLQPLPRRPAVAGLLQKYVTDAQQQRGTSDSEEELSLGLRTYFDKSLQVTLLYRGEREQAVQALGDGRVASCVYGAEHLLRLFVKLPELLAAAVATELQASQVAVMVQDLMLWMVENADTLFMSKDDYIDGLGGGMGPGGAEGRAEGDDEDDEDEGGPTDAEMKVTEAAAGVGLSAASGGEGAAEVKEVAAAAAAVETAAAPTEEMAPLTSAAAVEKQVESAAAGVSALAEASAPPLLPVAPQAEQPVPMED